jgi:hypothetical protein
MSVYETSESTCQWRVKHRIKYNGIRPADSRAYENPFVKSLLAIYSYLQTLIPIGVIKHSEISEQRYSPM